MIVLYLLAAHMVGDFVLQTRWQAAGKFGDSLEAFSLRAWHVTGYCVPFVPIIVVYSHGAWEAAEFMAWLWGLHFFTDRQRFYSTLGDVVGWKMGSHAVEVAVTDAQGFSLGSRVDVGGTSGRVTGITHTAALRSLHVETAVPPPNPWTPIPILIDQTLHVCQLALLGGIFFS